MPVKSLVTITVLNCNSLPTFKSRLKTHLFYTAFC